MTSLVWVRRKTNLCEVCGRVMCIGEDYMGRCKQCGSDFCRNCEEDGVCRACFSSSLFRAGSNLVVG